MVTVEKNIESANADLYRAKNRKQFLEREIDQFYQKLKGLQEKRDSLLKGTDQNEALLQTSKEELHSIDRLLEDAKIDREEALRELNSYKIKLASLTEKKQNYTLLLKRLEEEKLDFSSQYEKSLSRKSTRESRKIELHDSIKNAEEKFPELLSDLAILEENRKKIADQIETERIKLAEIQEKMRDENKVLSEQREDSHKLDIRFAQLAQEGRNIEQTLYNEFRLSPDELLHTIDIEEFKNKNFEKEIRTLKQRIDAFGDVNLVAKSEYDVLKERLDFLQGQSDDLTASITALEESIQKINVESRKRFKASFHAINERFQVLFPDLFGGGSAYLKLTDEQNLLETGVEIIAQPPGKKLQNMTLLSGGEKALTAISLIFSIFQIKPSPFCLLDEVDAPLDDANNGRFNRHVQKMTANSQFIIITHNKKTMEIGDALFGITMEEPGTSKVVSVDFHGLR